MKNPKTLFRSLTGLALSAVALTLSSCSSLPSGPRGSLAFGRAHAPAGAPEPVAHAILAGNKISGKPYKWGGGHSTFNDSGYDCSGTVSYALGRAGLIPSPMDSRSLMNFGESGKGRWITIYARRGHAFMVVAGLRLDTTGSYGNEGPGWRGPARSLSGFVARHPAGL